MNRTATMPTQSEIDFLVLWMHKYPCVDGVDIMELQQQLRDISAKHFLTPCGIFTNEYSWNRYRRQFPQEKLNVKDERSEIENKHLFAFVLCVMWIRTLKTLCEKPFIKGSGFNSSYGYKHRVERFCLAMAESQSLANVNTYIPNGSFIAAALCFPEIKLFGRDPNASFNISDRASLLMEDEYFKLLES